VHAAPIDRQLTGSKCQQHCCDKASPTPGVLRISSFPFTHHTHAHTFACMLSTVLSNSSLFAGSTLGTGMGSPLTCVAHNTQQQQHHQQDNVCSVDESAKTTAASG
jgi:hypothetical protein